MKEPVKARPGIPGDEPDWDSIPDFVIGVASSTEKPQRQIRRKMKNNDL